MDPVVHIIYLLKKVINICATLHEVMMVVEVPMALPITMDITLISLVVDMMVIMVHLVVVMVVLQMILMEQAQKVPLLLSPREGKDKTDMIDIPLQNQC